MKMSVCFPFLTVSRQLDEIPCRPGNQQDSQFGDATSIVIVVFASLAVQRQQGCGWSVPFPF